MKARGFSALPASRRNLWFVIIALCIALGSTLLHFPSLKGQLVTDDLVLVSDFDRRGCGDKDPVGCFHNLIGHFYYRPMLSASFAFGQMFHNNDSVWFHRENLAMHLFAVLACIWAFRLLFRRRHTALIAGAVVAFHPFNVTVTSWIGGRTDTMALGFMAVYALGVMQAGRRIRLMQHIPAKRKLPGRAGAVLWASVAAIALLASVFTKEQSMGLLFLAPMLAMGVKGASHRKKPFPYWTAVYLIPVGIFAVVAHSVLQYLDFDHADWSIPQHIEMVGRTMSYYASEFFLPTVNDQHVSTIGPWNQSEILRALIGYAAAVLWCVCVVRTWKNRQARLCLLWASLCIGPVLNVIPIPNALAAPFRTAVAMFGVSGCLALLLSPDEVKLKAGSRLAALAPRLRLAAGACLAALYLTVTVMDVPNWMSEWTYVQAQVAADPNFVCARASVASGYALRGDLQGALSRYNVCLEMLFGKDTPVEKYADMLRAPHMLPVMQSMSTLRYRPLQYIPQVIRERGKVLLALKRYEEAARDFRAVLTVSADDTDARTALVSCYRSLGQNEQAEAVKSMQDVLAHHPL